MSQKVRLGIIGLGNMGSAHVSSVKNVPQAELTAVCDRDKTKADKFAAQSGAKAFYSVEDLFAAKCVDAVLIAVPHYDHTPIAIAAFAQGLHVLCEKPIAVSAGDAQKMIDAHKKHPELRFGLMFQQRTHKAHRKIKELIQNGEFGKIMRVNWIITDWFRSQTYYDSGSWRATWSGEGGGVLLNQCPHNLDLFQWFFGVPEMVSSYVAIGKYHKIEVEDDVNTFCRFADGSTGNFITSTGEMPGTNRLEITGSRGRLVFENNQITFRRTEVDILKFCAETKESFPFVQPWEITIPVQADTGHPHQDVIDNFIKAVLDPKVELVARGEEGINSVMFGNAMLLSGLKNKPVSLPLDNQEYYGLLDELIKKSNFKKNAAVNASVDMSKSF